jgi:hypothetical protein
MKITDTPRTRLAQLRQDHEAHEAACDAISPRTRNGWRVITPDESARIQAIAPFNNDLRDELETLQFLDQPPERLFCYPSGDLKTLTGFMGNTLARVISLGSPYRSNMGDKRQHVRVLAINGVEYSGTIYGTYARLRMAKTQR